MIANYTPLLSVIIPVYNGEKYLEETVNSIQKSEYNNLEIIIIDDGSTDSSFGIIQKIMETDRRVHYYRQENQGIAAARNCGIEMAKGEYLCFCDQDDIVDARMYSILLNKEILGQAELGMCGTGRYCKGKVNVYEIVSDGEYIQNDILECVLYPILFQGYKYSYIKNSDYLYGTIWKCIFRSDFIRNYHLRFKNFVNYEDDWIFLTEALSLAKKVITSNITGYYWRINSESKSHRRNYLEDMPTRLNKLDEYVYAYLQKRLPEAILEQFMNVYISQHYLEMYDNLLFCSWKEKKKFKYQLIEYLDETDFKRRVQCRMDMKKGLIRKNALYYLLSKGNIEEAMVVNGILKRVEGLSHNINSLNRLERRLKSTEVIEL